MARNETFIPAGLQLEWVQVIPRDCYAFFGKVPRMAKRLRLLFSPEDLKDLAQQRFEHPDPRVQQRFEVFFG